MSEDIQKIKDRIKKLLALATSDNPHEAEIAMRRAMKLMASHNLSDKEINVDEMVQEVYTSDYTKIPQFMRYLYCGVARAFGVYSFYSNGWRSSRAKVHLVGRKGDVERAMYMFVVAYRLIEKKSDEYIEARPYLSRTSRNDYRAGLASGFVSQLMEAFKSEEKLFANESGTDLVPVDSRFDEAEAWFNMNPTMKVEKVRDSVRNNIHAASGFEDGKDLRVAEGINSSGNRTMSLESK